MNRTLVLLLVLVLSGCSTFPAQMVGQFNAPQDFIVVKKDGSIFWSRSSSTAEQQSFVGIGTLEKREPGLVHVVTVSASQVFPKLRFSPDFSKVSVNWGEVVLGAASGRSTEYVRAPAK